MWAVILVSALLSLFGLVCATSPSLAKRQDCGSNYAECSPPGASTTSIPDVGGNLSSMYIDLLDSTKGIEASKRNIQSRVERLGLRSSSVDVCCKRSSRFSPPGTDPVSRCRRHKLPAASQLQCSFLLRTPPSLHLSLQP